MGVWNQIAGHKDANLFRHPVKKEHAPGYEESVRRPLDLGTIKHRIEIGVSDGSMDERECILFPLFSLFSLFSFLSATFSPLIPLSTAL